MSSAFNAMKQMLDAAYLESDYAKYMATHVGTDFAKRLIGESYPLPQHRRYVVTERISHMAMVEYDKNSVKQKLVGMLGKSIVSAGSIDLRVEENPLDCTSNFTGSAYVFNEAQMREFIREVEDAVKESLSQ